MSATRLSQLDGLRGIAACLVAFVFHARLLFDGKLAPVEGFYPISWLQHYSWSFVDLFFVLSGYIFAHCYLENGSLRRGVSGADFFVARIARLWPLHIVTLGWSVLILRHAEETTLQNILLSLGFLHLLIENPKETLNGPAWSVSVEVGCYLIFIVSAFAGRNVLRLTAMCAVVWASLSLLQEGSPFRFFNRGLLGFFCGQILFANRHLLDRVPTIMLVGLAITPLIILPSGPGIVWTTLFAWPALIEFTLRTDYCKHPCLVWLGDRSYAIYLCHIPIMMTLGDLYRAHRALENVNWYLLYAMGVLPVIVFANSLHERLEKPAQKRILSFWKFAKRGRKRQPNLA